jgi:predicted dehydrogenase
MLDKPLITTMYDYESVARIVNEGRIKIGLMLTERFNPPLYTLYKLIKAGELGELINFTFLKPHLLREETRPTWHFSKEKNGGILIDLLIHDFDLLRWYTGSSVEEFSGYMRRRDCSKYPDFYDSIHMIVKMKNKVTATKEADWWMPDPPRWIYGDSRIFCAGTKGRAEMRTTSDAADAGNVSYRIHYIKDGGDYEILNNEEPPVTLTEDFINRIVGKKDIVISGRDILDATYDTLLADSRIIKI